MNRNKPGSISTLRLLALSADMEAESPNTIEANKMAANNPKSWKFILFWIYPKLLWVYWGVLVT